MWLLWGCGGQRQIEWTLHGRCLVQGAGVQLGRRQRALPAGCRMHRLDCVEDSLGCCPAPPHQHQFRSTIKQSGKQAGFHLIDH